MFRLGVRASCPPFDGTGMDGVRSGHVLTTLFPFDVSAGEKRLPAFSGRHAPALLHL